jgi:hypothetical protein
MNSDDLIHSFIHSFIALPSGRALRDTTSHYAAFGNSTLDMEARGFDILLATYYLRYITDGLINKQFYAYDSIKGILDRCATSVHQTDADYNEGMQYPDSKCPVSTH